MKWRRVNPKPLSFLSIRSWWESKMSVFPKLFAQKLSLFTLSVLEAKLNADTGNPTYIRIMSVLDLKGGLVR